ncbi:MAG TPA: zf-HC2 domain-containing protein [Planctomycetota bacterium]|nr:zf-HC2 domain-containing protein [Planctomycetota bacterium]
MICSDVREALDALLDGELEAGEEARVRGHLEACADCERELEDLIDWHGTLGRALASEEPDPAEVAESRRGILDALSSSMRRRIPLARIAALLAIGLSVGIVASAVGFSRPPEAQVVRLVEGLMVQEERDARLRAVHREIERDLAEARKAVVGRGVGDPAARAIEVASTNLSRRLIEDPPEPQSSAAVKLSITQSVDGATVSLVQKEDGRVCVQTPLGVIEARNMPDLLARHPEVCRRYSIGGTDGFLRVADNSAGVDWKGRLDLLLRSGTWDEDLQWEAYRGWVSARAADAREIERRLKAHQERCGSVQDLIATSVRAIDAESIAKRVKTFTRAELHRNQERLATEMKQLDERLKEAAELRVRAHGLRIFAEDIGHD